MRLELTYGWDLTPAEAREVQLRLRDQVVLRPPEGLRVERVGGRTSRWIGGRSGGSGGS